MALIRGHGLTLAFGARPVLEQADITIHCGAHDAIASKGGREPVPVHVIASEDMRQGPKRYAKTL